MKTPKTREKLVAARETSRCKTARWSSWIAGQLLPVPIEELRITPDYPRLIEAMENCEFKSLLQEVRDEAAGARQAGAE